MLYSNAVLYKISHIYTYGAYLEHYGMVVSSAVRFGPLVGAIPLVTLCKLGAAVIRMRKSPCGIPVVYGNP